jgi:hypothetical protein
VATLQSVTGILSNGLFLKHFKVGVVWLIKHLHASTTDTVCASFKLRCVSEMIDFCIIKSLGHLDTVNI